MQEKVGEWRPWLPWWKARKISPSALPVILRWWRRRRSMASLRPNDKSRRSMSSTALTTRHSRRTTPGFAATTMPCCCGCCCFPATIPCFCSSLPASLRSGFVGEYLKLSR
ncbi:hypothetical protein SEVIR_4G286400v4 [Setaria viridis]|uniref:Uncharacterized protein n=1 Tax=Setaria viridis TaxID=4556 RepID=A0A4U6V5A1_SETVI|nr:hypothetical protein SEVIR_4G286400v2 [Setaria viridis]